MDFGQKNIRDIDLFHSTSFFGQDFFKFSGPLCVHQIILYFWMIDMTGRFYIFKCSMMFSLSRSIKTSFSTHSTFLILTFLFCIFSLGELTLMQTSSSSTESRNNSGSTVRIKNSLFFCTTTFFREIKFFIYILDRNPKNFAKW